jgi:hypothetical protein
MMGVLNNHIFILMVTHKDSKKKYDYLKPNHGKLKIKYWDRTRTSPGGITNSPCNIERGITVVFF